MSAAVKLATPARIATTCRCPLGNSPILNKLYSETLRRSALRQLVTVLITALYSLTVARTVVYYIVAHYSLPARLRLVYSPRLVGVTIRLPLWAPRPSVSGSVV